ncbi:hypothetical protein [Lentzea atacamensis]|nr:hypothetical protein [Lentzea atacamensis]
MSHGAKVTRWLLVCVLFVGVVGMHHVAMSGAMPATHVSMPADAHGEHEPESPSQPHDMLNMCLAVLSAVVFVLLAWLLTRVVPLAAQRVLATPAWPRAPGRPPPAGGRALLSAVCVLRL